MTTAQFITWVNDAIVALLPWILLGLVATVSSELLAATTFIRRKAPSTPQTATPPHITQDRPPGHANPLAFPHGHRETHREENRLDAA